MFSRVKHLLPAVRRRGRALVAALQCLATRHCVLLKGGSHVGTVCFEGTLEEALFRAMAHVHEVVGVRGVQLPVGTANASTRDAWVEAELEALPRGTRLLDAGAGEMQYKKFCGHLNYVSQDLAEYDGSGNAAGLQTGRWDMSGLDIVSDICSIPVDDGSFDAVLCTEVFEHLPDPVRALQELTRILRPGGRLIMTAPFCSLTHFAPYHYATGFNKYFYLYHLEALGYRSIAINENGNYFEFLAQELRRMPQMAKDYSSADLGGAEQYAIGVLLEALQKLSVADKGSAELLHFDCQVTATKC